MATAIRSAGSPTRHTGRRLMLSNETNPLVSLLRLIARPFGYLAFVIALTALSASARLLGESHELGFFSGRVARMVWRYPEVTRRGVQMAWLVWAALLAIAASPLDPIASWWDEGLLVVVGLICLWRWISGASRDGR